MAWRFIPFQHNDAFTNMAIDEAVMESVRNGGPPTLRFYGWRPSAVSIGFFQGLHNEVDLDACKKAGVDVVRRITGGGAVYHDTDGEVTYSLIAPESDFSKNIIKSYAEICEPIIRALSSLGIKASFKPINDIVVGEGVDSRKISGNAQTRQGKVLLQHGTVLYDVDVDRMFSLLKVPDEKLKDKLIHSVKKRVTCVTQASAKSRSDLIDALQKEFFVGKDISLGVLTQEEEEMSRRIAKEKFSAPEWVAQR